MNSKLIIYRDTAGESGASAGKGSKFLGYARVTQVMKDMSKAELIGRRPEEIREMDRVIFQ